MLKMGVARLLYALSVWRAAGGVYQIASMMRWRYELP